MNFTNYNKKINYFGEFVDSELEREFSLRDVQRSLRFIKAIILILSILNILFLIADYFVLPNQNKFFLIAVAKILSFILVLVFYIRINHVEIRKLSMWVTFFEIIYSLLFLFVLNHYENPNFLIQGFGVMVIIICVFMIPNRFINMIIVSIFVSIGFLTMSYSHITDIEVSEFYAVIVYLSVVIILSSIKAYRNHYFKRIHYIDSKELLEVSSIDHLSGAYNRVKLDKELKKWVDYSKRYNTPLSLIIFDFDDFKNINDSYGHLVGDNVIIQSAQITQNNIREADVFARWGGDEFILLLPNTDIDSAKDLAERLRLSIENHFIKTMLNVTSSFGVIEYTDEDDANSLLYKADQMLYLAKKTGKNSVKG
ncbi:diguanylate cyclase [Alkalibaculum sporogenes]|uniref:diguanylate cyclase n=1 Tax=Alkalibaculum sporogenes TaxID=2655001 RepID=UPI00187B41E3